MANGTKLPSNNIRSKKDNNQNNFEELTDTQKIIIGGIEKIADGINSLNTVLINFERLFIDGAPTGHIKDYNAIRGKINPKKSIVSEINEAVKKYNEYVKKQQKSVDNSGTNSFVGDLNGALAVLLAKLDELKESQSLTAKIIIEGLDENNLNKLLELKDFNIDSSEFQNLISVIKNLKSLNEYNDIDWDIIFDMANVLNDFNSKTKDLEIEKIADNYKKMFEEIQTFAKTNADLIDSQGVDIIKRINSFAEVISDSTLSLMENFKEYTDYYNRILNMQSALQQTISVIKDSDYAEKFKTLSEIINGFISSIPKDELNFDNFFNSLTSYVTGLENFINKNDEMIKIIKSYMEQFSDISHSLNIFNEEEINSFVDSILAFNRLSEVEIENIPDLSNLSTFLSSLETLKTETKGLDAGMEKLFIFFGTLTNLGSSLDRKSVSNLRLFFKSLEKMEFGNSIKKFIEEIVSAIPTDTIEEVDIRPSGEKIITKRLIAGEQIKAFSDLIEVFEQISHGIKVKDLRKNLRGFSNVIAIEIPYLIDIIKEFDFGDILKGKKEELGKGNSKVDKLFTVVLAVSSINELIARRGIIWALKALIATKIIKLTLEDLKDIVVKLNDKDLKLTDSKFKKIDSSLKNIKVLIDDLIIISNSLKGIALTASFAQIGVKGIDKITEKLPEIVKKLLVVGPLTARVRRNKGLENIALMLSDIKTICKSLAIVGALAIFAGPGIIAATGVILGVSLLARVINSKLSSKDVENSKSTMGEFAGLLLIITGLCVTGVFLGGFLAKNWKSIIAFGILLATFIGMTVGIFSLAVNDDIVEAMGVASQFGILLLLSGSIMLFGGFLFMKYPWLIVTSLLFGLELAVFVGLILGVYALPAMASLGEALNIGEQLSLLVAISGIILLIGGALFLAFPAMMVTTLVFGLILGMFISLMLLAYSSTSLKGILDMNEMGKQLALLVGISAFSLLLGGGLFYAFPGMIVTTLIFAAILGLFIAGLMLAYSFVNMRMLTGLKGVQGGFLKVLATGSASNPAVGLALLTFISAATLLIGGSLIMNYPNLPGAIIIFGLLLIGYVTGLSYVLKLIGGMGKNLWTGIGAFTVISLITATVGLMLTDMAKTLDNVGWDAIGKASAIIIGGMSFITVLVFALGVLGTALLETGGILGLYAVLGAFAVIELLVYGLGVVLDRIIDVADHIHNVKVDGKDILKGFGIITSFIGMGYELMAITPIMVYLPFIAGAVIALSTALSNIAEAVQQYAELKVPVYDGTKIVGYRNLKKSDFKEAGENVGLIVTTLGSALMEVYDKHPDWFSNGGFLKIKDLLNIPSTNNRFAIVCNTVYKLGKVISKIAEGVKDYAELKIPIYDGTKIIGYRNLNKNDFAEAASNVGLIVTTLGTSIMQIYDNNKEWFSNGWWSDKTNTAKSNNRFSIVLGTVQKLGDVISSIAGGIKDYADLKIVEEWTKDEHGNLKPSKYRHLTSNDFETASENVKLITTTLGLSIMKVYDEHQDWFIEDRSWVTGDKVTSNNPFAIVLGTVRKLGSVISDISKGVVAFATGIPEYDKDGKVIGTKPITDFVTPAISNIEAVISVLGLSIMKVYDEHQDWFTEDRSWVVGDKVTSNNPFAVVLDTVRKLGKVISDISKGIVIYATGLPVYNNEGKIIGKEPINDSIFKSVSTNISNIITILGKSIFDAVKNNPEFFDDGEDSEAMIAAQAIGSLSNLVNSIAGGIANIAKLRLPIYDDKGHITGYEDFDENIINAASIAIEKIVLAIGTTIETVVTNNPKYFNDEEDSEFMVAATAIGNMANMVSSIGTAIKNIAELRLPIYDDKGNIIDYQKLPDTLFVDVANAIQQVLTSVINPIDILLKDKDFNKYLEDGEESPMFILCSSLGNMANLITSIGTAVKNIAEGTLSTYEFVNGKSNVEKGTYINKDVIEQAGVVISSIIYIIGDTLKNIANDKNFNMEAVSSLSQSLNGMSSFISSVGETVKMLSTGTVTVTKNGKQETIKITTEDIIGVGLTISLIINAISNGLTNAAKNFMVGKTTVSAKKGLFGNKVFSVSEMIVPEGTAEVISAIAGMGELISSIADFIVKLSTGAPIYKNGEIVGYHKIDKDIGKANETIQQIILAIAKGLKSAYIKLSEGDYLANIKNISDSIEPMTGIISGISDLIFNIAGGNMPIYDKNGNIVGYEKLITDKFTSDDLVNSLKKIVKMIPEAFSELLSEKSEIFGFVKVGDDIKSKSLIIAESMQSMNNTLTLMLTTIKSLDNEDVKKYLDKDNTILSNIQTAIGNIINLYKEIYIKFKEKDESRLSILDLILEGKNDNTKDIISSVSSTSQILNSLITLYGEIFTKYTEVSSFADFLKTNDIYKDINNLINRSFSTLLSSIFNINKNYLSGINENKDTYLNGINNVKKIINSLLDKINEIFNKLEGTGDEKIKAIIDFIEQFSKVGTKLKDMTSGGAKVNLGIIKVDNSAQTAVSNLKSQIESIEKIVSLTDKIKNYNENTFDNFITAFNKISNNLTLDGDKIKLLKEETDTINKFTRNINSISETRVNSIVRLSDSLNNLSGKFGDIEKMTEALTTTLSETLMKLSQNIKVASNIIQKTEKTQQQRQKNLEKAINNINTLMNKELRVKVDAEELEQLKQNNTQLPGGFGNKQDIDYEGGNNTNNYNYTPSNTNNNNDSMTSDSKIANVPSTNNNRNYNNDDIVNKLIIALSTVTLNVRNKN